MFEGKDNIKPVESKKIRQAGQHKKYCSAFCLIISILVPIISLAVYYALGLYNGVNSIIQIIGLGALFLLTYLAPRVALDDPHQ